ncbi:MAG: hypothetical protein HPY66_2615 [Firmicutes bacterium]|nr:hypothetical protein [Bacillota bacterium]MDI6704997.1 CvpA family protein [Bacillota bacterium]
MNWLDIIVIAIMISSAIKGYTDGFILSVFNIVGFIAAIVISKLYFMRLSEHLAANTPLYNRLYLSILKSMENSGGMIKNGGSQGLQLPKSLESIGIHTGVVQYNTGAVAENIAGALSTIIINILSIIAIYIAVRIVFAAAVSFLNALVEIPVLKQFNKLGGITVGLLKGILVLMVLFTLAIPLTVVFNLQWLVSAIDNSETAAYFYRYNFIVAWAIDTVLKTLLN